VNPWENARGLSRAKFIVPQRNLTCVTAKMSTWAGSVCYNTQSGRRVLEDILDTSSGSWYAIHTRSNFERQVAHQLSAKLIDTYLPVYREVHRWKDRTKAVEIPLFPGYAFARFVDTCSIRTAVLRTLGVVRILGSTNRIEPVPDSELEAIRKLLTANVPCYRHPYLSKGVRVRIRRGPLKGLEGYIVRTDRTKVVISVTLLARSVATVVATGDVTVIPGQLTANIA